MFTAEGVSFENSRDAKRRVYLRWPNTIELEVSQYSFIEKLQHFKECLRGAGKSFATDKYSIYARSLIAASVGHRT